MSRAGKPRRGPAEQPTAGPQPARPLSGRRRAAFTVAMLLVPLLFFGALEGALRLFGYGADYPLFVPVEGFPDLLVQNREVARRYFLHQRNVPNANADYFSRRKPQNGLRVVALGESSTAGFPFYWGAAFPRVLGNRLQAAYPDRNVEVVNTAMAAINSYTLLDFADEVIEIEPDVVVIYAGHNEYYGALGAASSETLGRSPAVVRSFLSLRRFRTVQLLRDLVGAAQRVSRPSGRPDGTLMARMIGEQIVPLDGDTFRAGRRQFVENMDRLLARLAQAGIPTYIATLASNERDQRPFTTVHSAGADTVAWARALRQGLTHLESGAPGEATVALRTAVSVDPAAAEGHYRFGQALLQAGRPDSARTAFVRARDRDALRFRAPEVFNGDIRRLAARHGARVVDVQRVLRNASTDGIIGHETMMEHLHPNMGGYARMADAFYDELAGDAIAGPPRPTEAGADYRVVSPLDSIVGYLRLEQLTRTWPFRPGEEQPFRAGPEQAVVDLARAYYEDRLDWQEATFQLAIHYEAAGRLERALPARRALVQAYPFVAQHLTALGSLHMRIAQERGRPASFAEAESWFRAALRRDARDQVANSLLGALLLNRRAPAEAVTYLETAVRLAPRDIQALYNLAGAYALSGRIAEARNVGARVLTLQPGHAGASALLASLPGSP